VITLPGSAVHFLRLVARVDADDHAILDEQRRDVDRLVEQPARVVAEVEDERLRTLAHVTCLIAFSMSAREFALNWPRRT